MARTPKALIQVLTKEVRIWDIRQFGPDKGGRAPQKPGVSRFDGLSLGKEKAKVSLSPDEGGQANLRGQDLEDVFLYFGCLLSLSKGRRRSQQSPDEKGQ